MTHLPFFAVGAVVARREEICSLAGSKDVGAVARAFDIDGLERPSVVVHRLLRRIVPRHAKRHAVLDVAVRPSVRRASVVQRLGAVADSVKELVEEKGDFAGVVRIRQVSALKHSDTVAKKATHTNTAPHRTQSIACACGGSNSCTTKKISC